LITYLLPASAIQVAGSYDEHYDSSIDLICNLSGSDRRGADGTTSSSRGVQRLLVGILAHWLMF